MAAKDIVIHSFDETQPGIDIAYFTNHSQPSSVKSTMALPHRHDFYSCFYLQKGSLNLRLDFNDLTMTAGSLFISYPGQVHQFFPSASTDFAGWGLAIKTELINHEIRTRIDHSLDRVALFNLDEPKQLWFTAMFELIKLSGMENQRVNGLDAELVRSLIHALLVKASAILQATENEKNHTNSSRRIELTRQFKGLVKENFLSYKKPSDYAALMNITVSYLNDTVKSVTGFSASYFIQQETVVEAQRLLFYSVLSVKEIAYQVGYDDYKYFIRLFGKFTGMSPSVFRNKNKISSVL